VQTAEEMAEEVFGRLAGAGFRDGVEDQDEEELEAVGYEDVFGVFEDDVFVWDAPGCGVVFQGLSRLVDIWRYWLVYVRC